MCSVVAAELAFGVAKSNLTRNRQALEMFLAPLNILPFDANAAWIYGDLRTELERCGTPIGSMDTMIAAHALSQQASLNTAALANIENLTYTGTVAFMRSGNALANVITGAAGADNLSGNDGDDSLTGAAGNDTLNVGAGNETLDGAAGNDSMVGGAGNDTYVVDATTEVIVELANDGTDTVRTALASYTLGTTNGSANVENLIFTGTAAFTGNGSATDNAITGGSGADTLNGLAGNDLLTGGAGSDRFIYTATTDSGTNALLRDIINDFTVGADRIDVSGIDANTATTGNGTFTWRGTAAINGAGQLSMAFDATTGTTVISGNVDANLAPDFTIALLGNYTATLLATDFVL